MYESRPEKDTPLDVQEELRNYGGESPDGQSIWRLVLAQNCRIHCFGRRNHIAKGMLTAIADADSGAQMGEWKDRGTSGTDGPVLTPDIAVRETRMLVPDRIEEGEFWIPRYRSEGWILERWFPPHVWGLRENWQAQKSQDGRTPLLAAYPQRGDYMKMAGPWHSIAQAGDLKAAIRCYNVQQRNNPVHWENHLQAMAKFEEMERQERADAYAEELAAQHRLGVDHILRSVSTSAQEFRNVVSKHSAGGVHLGSSEKWG